MVETNSITNSLLLRCFHFHGTHMSRSQTFQSLKMNTVSASVLSIHSVSSFLKRGRTLLLLLLCHGHRSPLHLRSGVAWHKCVASQIVISRHLFDLSVRRRELTLPTVDVLSVFQTLNFRKQIQGHSYTFPQLGVTSELRYRSVRKTMPRDYLSNTL